MDRTLWHFGPFFALSPPPPTPPPPKSKFQKNEKTPGDIIIIYTCVPKIIIR